MTGTEGPPGGGVIARRLDRLFAVVRRADGREYSYEEVARGIRQRGGSITGTYLGYLRRDVQDRPTVPVIRWIADFFFVDAAYFVTTDAEAERIATELEALITLWGTPVRQLARRVDRLFAVARRTDGQEYTYDQAAAGIGERGGSLTAHGIQTLRRGRDLPDPIRLRDLEDFADDPRRIKELAGFFGVSLSYFLVDDATAERILDQLRLLVTLEQGGIQEVATRAGDLAAALRGIAELVRRSQEPDPEPPLPPEAG